MTVYFSFAIADSMFQNWATVCRNPVTPKEVKDNLEGMVIACNPSHAATLEAARVRYGIEIKIPDVAPVIKMHRNDTIVVMSVRGLPRLDATRHEYTEEEIASATFEFGAWTVTAGE